jgi:hypothetical protein
MYVYIWLYMLHGRYVRLEKGRRVGLQPRTRGFATAMSAVQVCSPSRSQSLDQPITVMSQSA